MAREKDLWKIESLQKSTDMFGISSDFTFSLSSRFSMAGKLNDHGTERLFEKGLLTTPGKLSSSGSMDKEDNLPSRGMTLSYPVTDLFSIETNDWQWSILSIDLK